MTQDSPTFQTSPRQDIVHELNERVSVWITAMSLGDTICTTPTIRAIKKQYPDHKIDVYAYHPEIFIYNSNVDRVFQFDDQLDLNDHYTWLNRFGYHKHFVPFISTQNKCKVSNQTTNLIDFCSIQAIDQVIPDSEKWLEVPISDRERKSLCDKIKKFNIDFTKAVVIHPSITWPSRTWPKERWEELTNRLVADGFQVIAVGNSRTIIPRQIELYGKELDLLPCPSKAINLLNSLSVFETICLLHKAQCLITMDSGLLHMGYCTDVNIVAMFTVIHPKFRQAQRQGFFDYKFMAVPSNGDCTYCSLNKPELVKEYNECFHGYPPPCAPEVDTTYKAFRKLIKSIV